MITIATALNSKGQAHVEAELDAMGLDWSVPATCSEIEEKAGFADILTTGEYRYEITYMMLGKFSYGYISITPDMVMTETVE